MDMIKSMCALVITCYHEYMAIHTAVHLVFLPHSSIVAVGEGSHFPSEDDILLG